MPLQPNTWEQKLVILCDFEAILVYIEFSEKLYEKKEQAKELFEL